ncbi:TolC family protein [Leptothrix discophora]|uniref:TolC family protein n=1 Tax=Leptothrix discophora TaxID=89 RepID=A0ABT9G2E3_LEPDI|nr:TolC family protein [Leptothrix discophora]MDP4300658.1 TolC family protein [Leptothrix discophora]
MSRRRLAPGPLPVRLSLAAATLALAGCATLDDAPGGRRAESPVAQAVARQTGLPADALRLSRDEADLDAVRREVDTLLREPLAADAALRIALINHRGLQARLADLGVAQADWLAAGRLPNPRLSFGKFRRGDEREIERGLSFELGHWLMLPWAREIEAGRLGAMQRGVTAEALALAAQVRKAWVQAVAARQLEDAAFQLRENAATGAELADRLRAAGNWSRLQQAREQGYRAQAELQHARARQAAVAARERLNRLLGLWGTQTAYTLPDRLPDLPATLPERPDLERQALAQRFDVQAARLQLDATARSLGLTRVTGWVNGLELGVVRNTSNEAPPQTGVELSVELPLFGGGQARTARAEALYLRSLHQAAQVAVEARAEVREADAAARSAWEIARHHAEVLVPLARQVSDENLLRYNGMFIGTPELLADARAQAAAVAASIEAQRDAWLAQADLELALVGKPELMSAGGAAFGGAKDNAGAAH